MASIVKRCAWAESDPLMQKYHDEEWGVPEHDSRALWEKLVLDGFQAGLSWQTILRKREAFRKAFHDFDPYRVAKYRDQEKQRLMADAGIIRSLPKIEAAIEGAKVYCAMMDNGEDFSTYCWSFVDGKPIRGDGKSIIANNELSTRMSKDLKKRGFKFVGPTIVYAWMQAVGMVDDHTADCFRR